MKAVIDNRQCIDIHELQYAVLLLISVTPDDRMWSVQVTIMTRRDTGRGHGHISTLMSAIIMHSQCAGICTSYFDYIVKLRRGSGKDRQGMASKAKGLKA